MSPFLTFEIEFSFLIKVLLNYQRTYYTTRVHL